MKALSLLAVIFSFALTLTAFDAEAARRFGGGKSAGMQRQMTPPSQPPVVAPARPASGAAMAQNPAKRSWMGPIAGLAAGLGLAALASHLGFGEQMASMMLIGLLVMAGIAVFGFIMRRRAAPPTPDRGLQYAGAGGARAWPAQETPGQALPGASAREVAPLSVDDSAKLRADTAGTIPADFDVEGFVRNAKLNFIRLQAANDAGNLDDLREFTTPEMFAELKMNLSERADGSQTTDVVQIDAEVIEVTEEALRYIVSVRFRGLLREEPETPAAPIDEVWHLTKSRSGQGGWLVAGVQQVS